MPPPAAGRGASPATIHTRSTPSAQMSAAASADGGAAESPASSGASNGRPLRSTILADDDTGDSVLRA